MNQREREIVSELLGASIDLVGAETLAAQATSYLRLRNAISTVGQLIELNEIESHEKAHDDDVVYWLETRDQGSGEWSSPGCGYDSYDGEDPQGMLEWLPWMNRRLVKAVTVYTIIEERPTDEGEENECHPE